MPATAGGGVDPAFGAIGLGLVVGWLMATLRGAKSGLRVAASTALGVTVVAGSSAMYGGVFAASASAAGIVVGAAAHFGLRALIEQRTGGEET